METARIPPAADVAVPPAPTVERPYYSITQAATLLGVSRVSLSRWIRDGRLPVAKLGHRTMRIKPDDLDQLLAYHSSDRTPLLDTASTPTHSRAGKSITDQLAPHLHWGPIGETEHFVQFYEEDAFLLDAVSDFIGAALQTGEVGIVVATPAHRIDLDARLAVNGLDVAAARAAGQYVALDAASTLARLMSHGSPDPRLFTDVIGGLIARAAVGGRRVRVFGEMVALLVAEDNPAAALRLEDLWNALQQTQPFSLFCGYSLDRLGDASLDSLVEGICVAHSRVVPAESYTALADPDDRLRAIARLQQKAQSLESEIAERKRAEEEIRRKEAELRDFFEQATIGLHWVGSDGTILWANHAELELLGYPPEEYIGRPIGDFYVDPDVIADVLQRLTARETLHDREVRLRCKDGSIKDVLVNSNVLWDGDRFVHTRCFTVDITRRKRAEQGVHFLSEASEVLASSLDDEVTLTRLVELAVPVMADWCVVDVLEESGHPRRLAIAHADPAKRAWAREVDQRYPPDWQATGGPANVLRTGQSELYSDLSEALRSMTAVDPTYARILGDFSLSSVLIVPVVIRGRIVGTITFVAAESGRRYDSQDLALAEELAHRAAVALDNARLHRAVQDQMAVHVDLNAALRKAAEARDRALADLQQLLHARDEFLSAAAHDLKTPLASIKGIAQLLHRRLARTSTVDVTQVVEGLATINTSTTRMASMVDELLDTARVQLGEPLELHPRRTDLVALADAVVVEFQQATDRHRIHRGREVPELVGLWDTERLERVLGNLLENAIKYSPAGGDIVVTCGQESGLRGHWAVLAVRDNGVGIPTEDLPRIFERFHRGKNVTESIVGTGIGLTGARLIVESHGGTLTVESAEGAGSTFTVRLPIDTDHEGANAAHSRR